jgi:hypothetical protein
VPVRAKEMEKKELLLSARIAPYFFRPSAKAFSSFAQLVETWKLALSRSRWPIAG